MGCMGLPALQLCCSFLLFIVVFCYSWNACCALLWFVLISVCFCRGKSSRTITFEQFKEALQELSKKRFKDKSDEEAVQEIYKLIEGKAPIISGVTVCYWSNGCIVLAILCSTAVLLNSPACIYYPQIQAACLHGPEGNNCTKLTGSKDYATAKYCTTVYSSVALSLLLLGIVVPPSSMVGKIQGELVCG